MSFKKTGVFSPPGREVPRMPFKTKTGLPVADLATAFVQPLSGRPEVGVFRSFGEAFLLLRSYLL
jgi:hypothetical protein